MAKFIKLKLAGAYEGTTGTFPVGSFAYRERTTCGENVGAVVMYGGSTFPVVETPEQIDAMLGVTEPERQTVRWYRYDSAGRAAVFWEHNVGGFVLIPEGQTVAAGWWRYEHTDCDERGKFDLLHRARAARGE